MGRQGRLALARIGWMATARHKHVLSDLDVVEFPGLRERMLCGRPREIKVEAGSGCIASSLTALLHADTASGLPALAAGSARAFAQVLARSLDSPGPLLHAPAAWKDAAAFSQTVGFHAPPYMGCSALGGAPVSRNDDPGDTRCRRRCHVRRHRACGTRAA